LGRLSNESLRRKFLTKHKALIRLGTVEDLAQLVVQKVRVSTQEALNLAEAAVLIAKRLGRKEALALGLRAKANALYSSGDNRAAIEHHQQAFRLYESLGIWKEAGRTLSSSIQPMILLGEYDQAFQAAERAREIFERLDDSWRLARLEINVGNIYHRQDRFEESISHYENAYRSLMPHKDTEGLAVLLSNMAVCLISLNDFPRALASSWLHAKSIPLLSSVISIIAMVDQPATAAVCTMDQATKEGCISFTECQIQDSRDFCSRLTGVMRESCEEQLPRIEHDSMTWLNECLRNVAPGGIWYRGTSAPNGAGSQETNESAAKRAPAGATTSMPEVAGQFVKILNDAAQRLHLPKGPVTDRERVAQRKSSGNIFGYMAAGLPLCGSLVVRTALRLTCYRQRLYFSL